MVTQPKGAGDNRIIGGAHKIMEVRFSFLMEIQLLQLLKMLASGDGSYGYLG
ncbi:MAG: hypothetical protein H6609_20260 [Ignavibacteriales bacterium]|nr:hypothetical protein [Ignavibacteriales bacterium]